MTFPPIWLNPILLDPRLRSRSLLPLRSWGQRIGLQARDALGVVDPLRALLEPRGTRLVAVSRFFGLDSPRHPLHDAPLHWLRITEPQATCGLAYFIRQGGAARALAFLRAIDDDIRWPAALADVRALAEVPVGGGRIDLLVTGKAHGRTWGTVVEAKFGHDLRSNPLAAYALRAKADGLVVRSKTQDRAATGCLVILAPKRSRTTTARLARNRRWSLLHWSSLLRRFERELDDETDDDEFRRFRRTLWDRIHD
ncbi:hypothetical protein [Sphingomonas sp. R86521]|uniref:hypothetical protein n=1 Tax=Sphingomonas sp. R86521 TaxID=3093860 RepID=UPI0036D30505